MSNIHLAFLLTVAAGSALAAQPQPQADIRERSFGRAPVAQLLLAHTGALELTDQQVVRLAAIARRAESRRRAMRASMDSARARFSPEGPAPADSAVRRQLRERMRADMQRLSDQQRADQRDALAILTPDQQARAWDLVASRGRDRGFRGRGMRRPGRGLRPGRGSRPERGIPSRTNVEPLTRELM